jgi:alpha-beta hydrolase superfamily lysophospholipase
MSEPKHTVVFIHGLWLAASSWQPWVDLFAERGFEAIAPEWPGEAETVEQSRANPEAAAGYGRRCHVTLRRYHHHFALSADHHRAFFCQRR